MQAIRNICIDLGDAGALLGSLRPAFASSCASHTLPEPESDISRELAHIGRLLGGLNPRDVSIWGQ